MNNALTSILGMTLTISSAFGQVHYLGTAQAGRGQKATRTLAKRMAAAMFPGEALVWRVRGCGASPSALLSDGRKVTAVINHEGLIHGAERFDYLTEDGWMPEVAVEVAH